MSGHHQRGPSLLKYDSFLGQSELNNHDQTVGMPNTITQQASTT